MVVFSAVGRTFVEQATDKQLTLDDDGSTESESVAIDFGANARLLCSKSGTCCVEDLCNTDPATNAMSRVETSRVAMLMSIALALIGVLKGF